MSGELISTILRIAVGLHIIIHVVEKQTYRDCGPVECVHISIIF